MTPIEVGRFGRPFGVLGWIKVISFTTPADNILKFRPWLIHRNSVWSELAFTDSKKHSNGIVVKLPDCNSPEEAALFTNLKIGIYRKQLPKLPENEYYWDDLIGLEVINKDGTSFGKVQDLIVTGANDVLVVQGKGRVLIPYLSHVIIKVDLSNKIIHVDWDEI